MWQRSFNFPHYIARNSIGKSHKSFKFTLKSLKVALKIIRSLVSTLNEEGGDLVSISPTLYAWLLCQYFGAKKVHTLNLSTKKFRAKHLNEKAARKMLMKLTPSLSSLASLQRVCLFLDRLLIPDVRF
jgi:hypothetical protein